MIRGVPFGSEHAYDRYHDAMTTDAELLYLLARHFPQRLADLPPAVMDSLVQRLQSGALHSLSAATTILALDAYAKAATTANPHLSIAEVLHDDGRDAGGRATPGAVAESKTLRALALPPGLLPKTEFSADASKLRFANDSDLNAYTLVEQSGFDRNVPTDALKNGFEIIHELTGADGKPVDHVKLGQELQVHLKFRAIGEPLYDVALVDLLPGGFELVVPPQDTTQALHQASEQPQPEGGDEGEGEGDEGEGAAAPAYEAWQCFFCSPGTNAALDYADLREDRAVFYASMDTSIHEIVYRVRATSAGSFVLPPAYGEAMYDTRKQARSMGGRIVVESP
jgi:uncharacterized protein YfaS (alpha-2-macroglobulin family)